MGKRALYLEQRVSIARKVLNENTFLYEEHLPKGLKQVYRQHIHDLMSVLEGFSDPETLARLGIPTPPESP